MRKPTVTLFLLALLLMLLPFSGCQTTEDVAATGVTTTKPAATNADTATPAPTTDDNLVGNMYKTGLPIVKETVTYKVVGKQPDIVPKDINDVELLKFMREETNIDIQIEALLPAECTEKVNLMISTNNLPDVFWGGSATDVVNNGMDGIFIPVEDLIEQWCPNMQALFEEYPQIIDPCWAPDGHLYGFPSYYDNGQSQNRGYYILTEALEQTGLGMPETTDDFLEVLRAFKNMDFDGDGSTQGNYPFSTCLNETRADMWNICMCFGMPATSFAYIMEDGKTVGCSFATEGYRDGLDFLHTMYAEGLADPEILTHDVQTYRAKVADYKYGVFTMWAPYNAFGTEKTVDELGYELLVPLTGPNGTQGWGFSLVSPTLSGLVITKACENPEIMARFADYCVQEVMSLQMTNGLLGQNLIDDGDGTYSFAEVYQDHEMFSLYCLHIITKDTWAKVEPGPYDLQRIPRTQMYLPVANFDAIFPMIIATKEESDQLAEVGSEISAYIQEMEARWIAEGGVMEQWDEYLAELDRLGLDERMAIFQQQYDRYLINKN